ncbi:NAD(P)-dependent oxidoreductase, partial [Turicimonas muris]|uniref:NAD(P)-dependent oxidoreductase n=2 Tax=Turicimonas muris TaxID=1796652 RepID=UPI00262669FA
LVPPNLSSINEIDLNALKELGIGLTRTTGFVEGAVAEHVMAYVLYFARRIDAQNKLMHKHVWKPTLEPGAKGKTLALYGFGGIGKEIAKRAVPFKMNVIYYCRHPNLEDEKTYGVKYVDEETLLREGDFLSLNVPLTDSTFHLIDKNKLDQMKTGSILINIARGPVIDEFAVTDALKSGKLGAAAVDVFPSEPCTDSPLADCPTAVLTPHTASSTVENSAEMNIAAVDNVLNYLQGTLDDKYLVIKGAR